MGKGKTWANKWSGARLFRLGEVTFFCTFELFSQGLPLPPTQETNTETGLLQCSLQSLKAPREKQKEEGLRARSGVGVSGAGSIEKQARGEKAGRAGSEGGTAGNSGEREEKAEEANTGEF